MNRWLQSLCALTLGLLSGPLVPAESPLKTIGGRILDADGKAVPSARVAIFDYPTRFRLNCIGGLPEDGCFERLVAAGAVRSQTTADAEGRFTLHVPGGLAPTDTVWAEGTQTSGWGFYSTQRGPDKDAPQPAAFGDIRLFRRMDCVVLVRGDARPITGADVYIGSYRLRTDRVGSAVYQQQLSGPATQRHDITLKVHAPGYASEEWSGSIPPGRTTHVVDLERESALSARIVTTDGKPVSHAVVTAAPVTVTGVATSVMGTPLPGHQVGTVRTDASGFFTLGGMRSGRQYRVTIAAEGTSVADGERIVTAGIDPVDIVMPAAVPATVTIEGLRRDEVPLQSDLDPASRYLEGPKVFLEALDASGAWQTVSSPRRANWLDSGAVQLRFDKVPVGTIRIVTQGDRYVVDHATGPLMIHAGIAADLPLNLMRRHAALEEAGERIAQSLTDQNEWRLDQPFRHRGISTASLSGRWTDGTRRLDITLDQVDSLEALSLARRAFGLRSVSPPNRALKTVAGKARLYEMTDRVQAGIAVESHLLHVVMDLFLPGPAPEWNSPAPPAEVNKATALAYRLLAALDDNLKAARQDISVNSPRGTKR